MSTFKIGDRVRVKANAIPAGRITCLVVHIHGMVGTVLEGSRSPWVAFDVRVTNEFDHKSKIKNFMGHPADRSLCFNENELELYLDSDKPVNYIADPAKGQLHPCPECGEAIIHFTLKRCTACGRKKDALQQLLNDLRAEGFGGDEPIDGGNVIDIINHHWDALNGNGE